MHILKAPPRDFFISRVSRKAPWVYIAYISEIFLTADKEKLLKAHQNKREALVQVKIFNELGYNVYVQQYLSKGKIPNLNFDIVFGHEPNFVRAALQNPASLKIHYVPGAYIEHRNGQIKKITDYVNQTYHSSIPYRRLLEYDNPGYSSKIAYELSDKILMIGSKFTIETFPSHLHSKITTIHQSTQVSGGKAIAQYAEANEFFFMGSYGNLLKGVSLLIEFFSHHPEYTINLVGPLEDDVKSALHNMLTNNIKLHGYIDVNSNKMMEIVQRCNFIIYPSGSEGMPGAVLNAMKLGLIPIVTRWSAFDEIEEYGCVLEDWTVGALAKGIAWSMKLSRERIVELKEKCSKYVLQTYTIDNYEKEFKAFIENSIRNIES